MNLARRLRDPHVRTASALLAVAGLAAVLAACGSSAVPGGSSDPAVGSFIATCADKGGDAQTTQVNTVVCDSSSGRPLGVFNLTNDEKQWFPK